MKMPKRQFMGHSQTMMGKMNAEFDRIVQKKFNNLTSK